MRTDREEPPEPQRVSDVDLDVGEPRPLVRPGITTAEPRDTDPSAEPQGDPTAGISPATIADAECAWAEEELGGGEDDGSVFSILMKTERVLAAWALLDGTLRDLERVKTGEATTTALNSQPAEEDA